MSDNVAGFIADLLSEDRVLQAYAADRARTLDGYGIKGRAAEALQSGDPKQVVRVICQVILAPRPVEGGDDD